MTVGIGRGFAKVQILKKKIYPYLLNLKVYFDNILHTHYYWYDLNKAIDKSSPRDFELTFSIGRDYAELKILKTVKIAELSGLL